jgi:hypothetical protein
LRNVARNLAGVTGEALQDYAGAPLEKGDLGLQGEDDQDDAPGGVHPDTATDNPVPDENATEDPKSLFWDPFAIIEQLGYKERPSAVTYGTLKAMVWKTPIVHSVIQTRIQQLASFCQPSRDRYDMGFKIRVRDSVKEPSPEERKWIQQGENLILRTGVTDNPRGRDTFEKFTRKLMWDSLVYDQACFEVVPNRRGEPAEWYAVDASTIRLADTASTYLNEDNAEAVRYVQIYDGMIISEYTQEELCFGVRNPRTDIRLFGYGTSEIEMLMTVITAILFGWEYNQKAFSQGSSQKGVLNFKGAIPERQLKAFRRHWYQMISGVENCVAGDSILWTPQGPITIGELVGAKQEQATKIWTGTCWRDALAYRTKDPKAVTQTTLANGVTVTTSPDHKFKVSRAEGPVWVEQRDLQIGDLVLVSAPLDEVLTGKGGALSPVAVTGLTRTEALVPMYDVEVYDSEHQFTNSGIVQHNSWRTPITNADELQWISMQASNRDMEYNAWFDFLIKISCAMLTIDPAEINFKYGNTGQRSQMNESANKEKITESKERGLRPLLRFLETNINQYIIWPLNEAFEFKFVGLDAKTKGEIADLNTKLVKTVRTVDELRAEDNMPPLPEGKGEVILDPTWLQFASGKDAAAQQMAPGAGAVPGADGQGDQIDFQQLLAEQEADQADDDDQADEDDELAEHQEATAKSLLQKSMSKARAKRLKLDLTL